MKIYVAGHRGLVGSAIVRAIEESREHTWIGETRSELNLLNREAAFEYVHANKPDWVIIAAAKVGGIHANSTYPVEFLSENLQIETNLIDACHAAHVERVLFLGSSCIYPKACPQPIKEEYLLTGPLEESNEAYALAKISGLKLIQAYRREYGHNWISAMPTNLYGPGDNYDLQNSHVLPALARKFTQAIANGESVVEVWGSGEPLREFLHADDLANACLHLLETFDSDVPINVGSGVEVSIRELADIISEQVNFSGSISWNTKKPDGTMRKVLDTSRIQKLGWAPRIGLEDGIRSVLEDIRNRFEEAAV